MEVTVPTEIDLDSAAKLRAEITASPPDAPLILRGQGDVFCRGVSLRAVAGAGDPTPAVQDIARVLEHLLLSSVPTIAVVEGEAVGGGLGLAAACDHVIATPNASFAMPELLYGLVPVVIWPALRRRASVQSLMGFTVSGQARSASDCLQVGLVDRVVEPGDLSAAVGTAARRFARPDPAALAVLREFVTPPTTLRQELDSAVTATVQRLQQPEVRERMRAYLEEGRPPWQRD